MKQITILSFLLLFFQGMFAQTADEVVNKFIEASGGKDKLNAIQTLHYNQLIKVKSPMGEFEIPIEFFREKNKFYRVQASMEMGAQSMNMFVLLTDTAGYVMLPPNPFAGTNGGLQKLDKKDMEGQSFQMETAGMFSPLVDYTTKGSTAELLKDEKVNKEDCYKLKLTMNNGQYLTYFINKASGLVMRVDAKGTMAANTSGLGAMLSNMAGGNSINKMEIVTQYSDYKEIDGVKFPTRLIYKTQMGDSESELTNIEVNKGIDAKWYLPK